MTSAGKCTFRPTFGFGSRMLSAAAISAVALVAMLPTPADAQRRGVGIAIGAGVAGAILGAAIANAARPTPTRPNAQRRASRPPAKGPRRNPAAGPAPAVAAPAPGTAGGSLPGQIVAPGMIGVAAGVAAGAAVAGTAPQRTAEEIVPASLTGDRGAALGGFAALTGSDMTDDERTFAGEHASAIASAFSPVAGDSVIPGGRGSGDSVRQLSTTKDNYLLRPGR